MRISDWSSDVCSSDLDGPDRPALRAPDKREPSYPGMGFSAVQARRTGRHRRPTIDRSCGGAERIGYLDRRPPVYGISDRSEEHKSELQTHMRTSYAVFFLKKKRIKDARKRHNTTHIVQHHMNTEHHSK